MVAHVVSGALVALVIALPASAAFAAPTEPIAVAPAPDFSRVDAAVQDAVASGEVPGAVVLVGHGDEILYERAFGSRRLVPNPLPMTPDTIFDIASLTKPLGTTLAVMSLVERGAIQLDAPLGRYLREFRGGHFRHVTIRRILGHSAGLPATPPTASVAAGFPDAAKALAALPLDYAPGSAFEYSDTGFMLLGEVVRRVSGEPLDRYLERILFRPLRLRDTTFHPREAVRDRIAPTQFHDGRFLQGVVHDPRARQLGGVAGHAGMFSTVGDLARICRMLVAGGVLDGRRILRAETIQTMWTRAPEGGGGRALGWDVSSPYARTMAPFFPPGSVGHTGFTGTAVWIDPPTRVYMLVLTSRVHPWGGSAAGIRDLRVRVAAAVGAALFRPPRVVSRPSAPPAAADGAEPSQEPGAEPDRPATPPAAAQRVRSGLDVLVDQNFALLAGQSVGLVTNQTGRDARGRRAIDLLATAPKVRLRAIFSPEHGLAGDATADVPDGRDPATAVPVWSLYGVTRRPTPAMLKGVTQLVFDVQDVGVRYYTYLTTLVYVMEEAAHQRVPVVVLDRPNPITGRVVEGPLMDPDLESFTGAHPVPVRTGLTVGEFARLVAAERKIPVSLTIVAMDGWRRSQWYDETGLPWVNPSPNIRSVTGALLYSGVGLLEATNVSVGRGTEMPFEVVGAPWVVPEGLAAALNREGLAGVRFEPLWFTPTSDRHAHVACGGVRLVVTDRETIRPVRVALAIASALRERHRDQFRPESIQNLLVNRLTMWAFLRDEPLDRLQAWADMDRSSFLNRRASYLIYR